MVSDFSSAERSCIVVPETCSLRWGVKPLIVFWCKYMYIYCFLVCPDQPCIDIGENVLLELYSGQIR